jgi:hypothetical protein
MRATEEVVHDIPEGSTGHGCGHGQAPHGNAPPPPPWPSVRVEQLLTTQNELMRMLMENEARHGADRSQHPR